MAAETDDQINARLEEIRDETAPSGNTNTRIFNAFKNIFDTLLVKIPGSSEEAHSELASETLDYSVKYQFRNTVGALNITAITNARRDAKGVVVRLGIGTVVTFDTALNVEILTEQDNIKPSYLIIDCIDKDTPVFVANFVAIGVPAAQPNITPPAPTNAVIDDTTNTMAYTLATGYVLADHEATGDGGTIWAAATNPLSVGSGAKAINMVGVRVKAATGRNAGPALYNQTAFTADPVTPTLTAPTNLEVDETSQTELVFSWDAVTDAENYIVKINGTAQAPQVGTTKTITGLAASTSRTVEVKATATGYNDSPYTAPLTGTTAPLNYNTLEIYNKHQGINEVRASYPTSFQVSFTASSATTATINWGDSANTTESVNLSTGINNFSFQYTGADAANTEKKVSIEIATYSVITGFSIPLRSEVTKFGEFGFEQMNLTSITLGTQLISIPPIVNAGVTTVDFSNNSIDFATLDNALQNCKTTLQTLKIGSGVITGDGALYGQNRINGSNDIIPTITNQTYDLRTYTALKVFGGNLCGIGTLLLDGNNNGLEELYLWGNPDLHSISYLPNGLKKLYLWAQTSGTAGRVTLTSALPLGNCVPINTVQATYAFAGNAASLDATIAIIEANKASYNTGAKVFNNLANPTPNSTSQTYITGLEATYNWDFQNV